MSFAAVIDTELYFLKPRTHGTFIHKNYTRVFCVRRPWDPCHRLNPNSQLYFVLHGLQHLLPFVIEKTGNQRIEKRTKLDIEENQIQEYALSAYSKAKSIHVQFEVSSFECEATSCEMNVLHVLFSSQYRNSKKCTNVIRTLVVDAIVTKMMQSSSDLMSGNCSRYILQVSRAYGIRAGGRWGAG